MTSQHFFFMGGGGVHPIAGVSKKPEIRGRWTNAEPVKMSVEEPLTYNMDLTDIFNADEEALESMDLTGFTPDDYNIGAMITFPDQPLIRHDLLAVLETAGVDNLQLFEAIVSNPISKRKHHNFSAFNLVGIADFDWARDLRRKISQREFRVKTPPFLMFYLYDDGPIVVHNSVRLAVEDANIEGMYFVPTYERF